MRSSSSQNFEKVDQLRFLAALVVIFWYGYIIKNGTNVVCTRIAIFNLLEEGHTGVFLFMVLIGYIFAYSVDKIK